MQNSNAVWKNDNELCDTVGDWWACDMELHNDATLEQNVQSANAKLEEMYCTLRVLECREYSSDMLEWLVVGLRD